MSTPPNRHIRFDLERTNALSDGVFAIALTLLVLDLQLPDTANGTNLLSDLGQLLPELEAYVLSFAVLGFMWIRHHNFFADLHGLDRTVTVLNLVYLGLIAFVPFPTSVLADYDEPAAVALYATTIGLTAAVSGLSYHHAARKGLIRPEVPHRRMVDHLAAPLVFGLSIPLAFLTAGGAELFWIALIVLGAISSLRRRP